MIYNNILFVKGRKIPNTFIIDAVTINPWKRVMFVEDVARILCLHSAETDEVVLQMQFDLDELTR